MSVAAVGGRLVGRTLGPLTVLIVLGIFLAIDSLRNSLIVSYGLLWGLGAIIAISAVARALPRRAGGAAHAAGIG
jgi:hypothetical protein